MKTKPDALARKMLAELLKYKRRHRAWFERNRKTIAPEHWAKMESYEIAVLTGVHNAVEIAHRVFYGLEL